MAALIFAATFFCGAPVGGASTAGKAEHAKAAAIVEDAGAGTREKRPGSPSDLESRPEEHRRLPVFFGIGIVINVVMMVLFAFWFRGEWKKNKPRQRGR